MLRPELADDLPAVTANRVQLQQVILNLLRNASDAMVGLDDGATAGVVATAAAHRAMAQDASAVIVRQVVDSPAWPAECWACPVSRCR